MNNSLIEVPRRYRCVQEIGHYNKIDCVTWSNAKVFLFKLQTYLPCLSDNSSQSETKYNPYLIYLQNEVIRYALSA